MERIIAEGTNRNKQKETDHFTFTIIHFYKRFFQEILKTGIPIDDTLL